MLINNKFSSPNCAKRQELIEYVILHFTELSFKDALARLCDPASKVSAHYIIKETGEIFQLVEDQKIAWHAGASSWYGKDKLNQNSIGIELDNLGNKKFSKAQMHSCLELCSILSQKYNIPKANFIGHSDIAPERKLDPGIFFDWKLLHEKGFGIWHGLEPSYLNVDLYKMGDVGEGIVDIQIKLKKIGYNIEINGTFDQQTNYVIRAFQSKFCPHIIEESGLAYYNNPDSEYSWNSCAGNALNKLSLTLLNIH
jgi:N-acetylmuramoyl-L-alanine amidase